MKRLTCLVPWLRWGEPARPSARRCCRRRLTFEEFEDRNLLSGAHFATAGLPSYLTPFNWTTSAITVNESFLIQDLNVTLYADEGADGSLVAYLQRPDQTFIYLFGFVAASGADFHDTTLDDEASLSISQGVAPFTGTYRPFESLTAADNTNSQGTWTLWLYNFGNTYGLLSNWSMEMQPAPPVAESEPNDTPAQATHVATAGQVFGRLDNDDVTRDVDYFTFTVTEPGTFQATVTGLDSRLVLLAPDSYVEGNGLPIGGGGVLRVSEDRTAADVNPVIRYALVPGRYFLAVSSTMGQAGAYTLTTSFDPAPNPFELVETGVPVGNQGDQPVALILDDFNRDGFLDLASANQNAAGVGNVAVLLGKGDGTFQTQTLFELRDPTGAGFNPAAVATTDFNNDGRPDLALRMADGSVHYLPGVGDGSFLALTDAGSTPPEQIVAQTRAVGDFNRDGTVDDAALSPLPLDRRLLVFMRIPPVPNAAIDGGAVTDFLFGGPLSDIGYLFEAYGLDATVNPSIPSRATPQVADLNGDAFKDLLVVSGAGDILVRYGRKGGIFDAPLVINADRDFTHRARAVVVLAQGRRAELAAIDVGSNTISFYARDVRGWSHQPLRELDTGILPVRLISADLDGDGRKDLVTGNQVLGTLSLFLAQADGSYQRSADVKAGVTISDIVAADVNGDGAADLLLANPASGEVGVLLNQGLADGTMTFAPFAPYRAGADDAYGAVESGASAVANDLLRFYDALVLAVVGFIPDIAFEPIHFGFSPIQTGNLVVGDFDEDQIPDVVATNRADGSLALLLGKGEGSLIEPILVAAGTHPTVVRAADFNGDGHLDLAILDEGTSTVAIFSGDGAGHFEATFSAAAGNAPTGLTVQDVNGDGIRDLALGNVFGDVLLLLGNGRSGVGTGTFRSYQRTERNIALAVSDLDGDGRPDFVFANQARDRVAVRFGGTAAPDSLPDPDRSVLGPGALTLSDLNSDGIDDLVVANSGSNNVLVYLGLGQGEFDQARSFFAGTNPSGVTVADINGDAVFDVVVANPGSNDVSILLGAGQGTQWDLSYGPRLQAGAAPVSTAVADVTGPDGVADGKADLLITNRDSNDVFLLPGSGGGFFADQNLQIFDTGPAPVQSVIGDFTGDGTADLVVLNSGGSSLTFVADFRFSQTIGSGGVGPSDALTGDFNRDGLADLLVANNGDGHVTLFLGDADGLGQLETITSDLFRPTALALANLRSNTLEVYVAAAGEESISTLTFRLSGAEANQPVALIQPLGQTSLALVATLIIGGRADDDASPVEILADNPTDLAAIAAALVTFEEEEADNEYPATRTRIAAPETRENTALHNFLSGVDEALDAGLESTPTPPTREDPAPQQAPEEERSPETSEPEEPGESRDDEGEALLQGTATIQSTSILEAGAASSRNDGTNQSLGMALIWVYLAAGWIPRASRYRTPSANSRSTSTADESAPAISTPAPRRADQDRAGFA